MSDVGVWATKTPDEVLADIRRLIDNLPAERDGRLYVVTGAGAIRPMTAEELREMLPLSVDERPVLVEPRPRGAQWKRERNRYGRK